MNQGILSLSALLAFGCSTKHPGAYEVGQATRAADGAEALQAEADALWANRGDGASLDAALAKYEEAYNADPTNRAVAVQLTRGFYFKGDAQESDTDAKLAAWETSITWGKRCMALNDEFTAKLSKGDETESTAIAVATADDVPCIYWTATSLGKWAKGSGLAKTLKHIGTVKAYITRVGELEPDYFHGAVDRYWGAYWAAIPSFAGQDLAKSKTHFDASIASAPTYLGTRVLLAEYWAVKTQNKAAFTEALEFVVAADANIITGVEAEQAAEVAKAKALLAQTSDLFAE